MYARAGTHHPCHPGRKRPDWRGPDRYGKTAAYLLPVLNQLSKGGYPEDAINCIIMSPTRELAMQIDQQMEGFSYFMPVSSVAVYGGNDGIRFEQEKKGLTLGADVVIATPGRLISHLSLGYVDCRKYPSSSSTKQTACSIWDSRTTSCRLSNIFRKNGRPLCSPPPCRPKSSNWPRPFFTTQWK